MTSDESCYGGSIAAEWRPSLFDFARDDPMVQSFLKMCLPSAVNTCEEFDACLELALSRLRMIVGSTDNYESGVLSRFRYIICRQDGILDMDEFKEHIVASAKLIDIVK